MEYLLHILIFITIYIILAQSLVLVAGFGKMISLSHAGFYGIGAYTTAILSINYGLPFLITLPLAMIISGIIALMISLIALRTVEDYFIICTLGIQIILFSIMNNWMSLTRGPLGIPGIPALSIFGYEFNNKISFLILSIILTSIVFFILRNITKSAFGKVLIALSEDEIYTQSIGKNVYLTKIITFTLGAMIAAIPGVLYAHYISYIDPSSFTVNESIFILSIVIIGGMRNLIGALIAACFLVILPEVLRFIGFSDTIAANIRQIIYGASLVIVMFNPKSLIERVLFKRKMNNIS
ncbi:MAG: branched-chain amino acid ABC transporter permease [Ignavibacteriae bacterium]|nr:branched-chain amino acid ABC transporter permease [Ignavibacteriota bacterium]